MIVICILQVICCVACATGHDIGRNFAFSAFFRIFLLWPGGQLMSVYSKE